MSAASSLVDAPAQAEAHVGPAAMVVSGLVKRFGQLTAVDDVSFSVPQGAIFALIGPNGAGKSTVFNLAAGLLPPDAGNVELFGRRVDHLLAHERAMLGLGRTFQAALPFANMTVVENVMVGMRHLFSVPVWHHALATRRAQREEQALRAHARECLEAVGLVQGDEAEAGALTAGQQRLLSIARVIATRPRLLLLDEPAAGLNETERTQLAQTVRRLRDKGMTVLLIEHSMDFVMSLADRIVVLDYGRTLAEGSPEQILKNPEVVAAYLGVD